MNRSATLLALAILLGGPAWALQQPKAKRSSFQDELYGYSIDTPRFPGSDRNKPGITFQLAGPAVNGFSSNINIIQQPGATTLQDFTAQSKKQIEQMSLKLNAQRTVKVSGRDAWEADYEGEIPTPAGKRKLHFLQLSVIAKDRVFVITCTASPEEYAAAETEFRASIASFALRSQDL